MLLEFFSLTPENITGIIALGFTLLTFFFDSRLTILLLQVGSLCFYSAHLYLFGMIATSLFLLIQIFRNIIFAIPFPRIVHTITLCILLMGFVYINSTNGGDPFSWLGMIGSIIGTIALWLQNTTYIRIVFFCSVTPWLIYVFLLGEIFPIIMQLSYFVSLLVSIVRFDVLKKS